MMPPKTEPIGSVFLYAPPNLSLNDIAQQNAFRIIELRCINDDLP